MDREVSSFLIKTIKFTYRPLASNRNFLRVKERLILEIIWQGTNVGFIWKVAVFSICRWPAHFHFCTLVVSAPSKQKEATPEISIINHQRRNPQRKNHPQQQLHYHPSSTIPWFHPLLPKQSTLQSLHHTVQSKFTIILDPMVKFRRESSLSFNRCIESSHYRQIVDQQRAPNLPVNPLPCSSYTFYWSTVFLFRWQQRLESSSLEKTWKIRLSFTIWRPQNITVRTFALTTHFQLLYPEYYKCKARWQERQRSIA